MASNVSALVVAAVLQLLLLLAGNAVPSAGQDTSQQQCFWPLNDTEAGILFRVSRSVDYFPLDLAYITTCVNVGVTCSDSGHVRKIQWQSMAIQGELPSEIFQLVHLEYLSLRDNYLRGSIPSEIGNLVDLTFLDISNNSFSGPFPTFFSRLTKLAFLDMGLNKFSGSLPDAIGNMVSLIDLFVKENDFTGALPTVMGRLTNLHFLDVSHNRLSGTIPQSFSSMASLGAIWLHHNLFSGSLAPLAALSYLSFVYLCCNRFNGSIPSTFGSNLYIFDVSVNDLTGPLPSSLGFTVDAISPKFNTSFNRLSGEIPFDFINVNFYILDISHNNLSGRAFFSKPNGDRTTNAINYSHNRFSGALDPSLSTLTNLLELDMSGNLLTGSVPAFISRLTDLTMLDLSSNQFTGTVPPAVSNPTGLVSINLAHNLLQGSIPRALSRLASLTYLNVSSNQLSGDITPALSPLRSLEIVDISAIELNGSVPPFFRRMPNMTHLDMSINLLSGSLPPSILNLRQLSHLNVSRNRLSGPLPNAAASPALIIDLSFNTLSGTLESQQVNLKRLALLAVHHNQLSGPIPEYLCQSVLQIMLLSSNAFSGALPQCLPFISSVQLIDVSNNLLFMDAASFQNMPPISLDLSGNYLYGSLSPSPNITLSSSSSSSSSSSPPIPSLVLPATPQPQSLPPWAVQDATNSEWAWVWQGGQQGATGAGGASGGNISSAAAWLAVEGNCLGSEVVGQQRGATECAAVCGIEPGQGPCGGAGAGQCVVQSGWPPSLSCSCASGYVAVTAAGTANTTTCELPPPSPSTSSSGLSAGAVAGIVVGVVLLLAAVAGLLFFFLRPSKRRSLDLDQCVAFRIEDIRRATNNFSPESKLGEGGFGSVFKGTAPDGTLWAIKRAKFLTNDFEKEVRAVATLRHQHLVRLLGYCMDYNAATGHQEQILVYEFVPHGDLSHYLHAGDAPPGSTRVSLSFEELVRIAQGAAEGLAYLHHSLSPPIVHRDVKPANILIGESRTAKLGDFGLVKMDNLENATNLAGTPGYMDPDYGDSKIVTTASDVFSFGVVLLEMVSGKRAVLDESDIAFSNRHISIWANELVMTGKITQVVMEDLKAPPDAIIMFVDLAMDCLKRPGALRPEMREVARRLTNILAVAQGNAPVGALMKQKSWAGSAGNGSSAKAVDEAAEPFKKEIA